MFSFFSSCISVTLLAHPEGAYLAGSVILFLLLYLQSLIVVSYVSTWLLLYRHSLIHHLKFNGVSLNDESSGGLQSPYDNECDSCHYVFFQCIMHTLLQAITCRKSNTWAMSLCVISLAACPWGKWKQEMDLYLNNFSACLILRC